MSAGQRFPRRSYTPKPRKTEAATAWEPQAQWYDALVGDDGDDFYRRIILPAVLARLGATAGQTVLDVGCGQGVLGRVLAATLVKTIGVDASPTLLDAARRRGGPLERYELGDVRALAKLLPEVVTDHAACVLSLQDLDPIGPVLEGTAKHLRPGGKLVLVLTHPCFRVPKRSGWGWDDERELQYRRLDGYLHPLAVPIKTHPGQPADPTRTLSFHRPFSTYVNALGNAGFAVAASDELCTHRRGTQGLRSAAEDRAFSEFPLFLVLTAIRLAPEQIVRSAAPAPIVPDAPSAPQPMGRGPRLLPKDHGRGDRRPPRDDRRPPRDDRRPPRGEA